MGSTYRIGAYIYANVIVCNLSNWNRRSIIHPNSPVCQKYYLPLRFSKPNVSAQYPFPYACNTFNLSSLSYCIIVTILY